MTKIERRRLAERILTELESLRLDDGRELNLSDAGLVLLETLIMARQEWEGIDDQA